MSRALHPYHLVDNSPWPLWASLALLSVTLSVLKGIGTSLWGTSFVSALGLSFVLSQWVRDTGREDTLGHRTFITAQGLKMGIWLMLASEVMFFVSFFWAFFHVSLAPTSVLGECWPPSGISAIHPLDVPLLNTAILLTSGVSVTWAHKAARQGMHSELTGGLIWTAGLGVLFLALQGYEYYEASFTIADSVYGSTFYLMTGFHGFHVLVGAGFLAGTWLRATVGGFSQDSHLILDLAVWYWHFVDVVWIFLYLAVYCWGNKYI